MRGVCFTYSRSNRSRILISQVFRCIFYFFLHVIIKSVIAAISHSHDDLVNSNTWLLVGAVATVLVFLVFALPANNRCGALLNDDVVVGDSDIDEHDV